MPVRLSAHGLSRCERPMEEMMRQLRSRTRLSIALVTALGGVLEHGCADPWRERSSSPIAVTGVQLKTSTTLPVGGTELLLPAIAPLTATDQVVRWETDQPSVVAVSADGLVTGVGPGVASVTVTTRDGGRAASCLVRVVEASPGHPEKQPTKPAAVRLTLAAARLTVGDTMALGAEVVPATATDRGVVWSTSDASVASLSATTGGDIEVKGLAEGTVTITAMAVGDPTKRATCVVVVAGLVAVSGLSVSPSTLALASGQTRTLIATITPSGATNQGLTWTTSDAAIASLSASTGHTVMVTSYKTGTATITAKTDDGARTASCTVVVTRAKEAYTFKDVRVGGGGAVTGIVFGEAEANTIFVRTAGGGAFRWDQPSGTWVQLLDFLGHEDSQVPSAQLVAVESIAVDPSDSRRVYLACGSGLSQGSPAAIFASDDGAKTFVRFVPPFTMAGGTSGNGSGERLQVDPNLGSILFFGSRTMGLFRSANFGLAWAPVLTFPVSSTANRVGVNGLVFDPRSATKGKPTQILYASVSQVGGLYVSTNGGLSWRALAGQPATGLPHTMKLAPDGFLYVTYGDTEGPGTGASGALWRYDTSTARWTDLSPVTGVSFGGIAFDRRYPTTLMVTTNGSSPNGIFRTTDGGGSWVEVGAVGPRVAYDTTEGPWVDGHGAATGPGEWLEDIEIDPFDSRRVMYAERRGLWASEDIADHDTGGGMAWRFHVTGLEGSSGVGGGKALLSPPRAGARRGLYSALVGLGGFVHEDPDVVPSDADHFLPGGGTHASIDVAWQKPSVLARTHAEGTHGAVSLDYGKSWTGFASSVVALAGASGPGTVAVAADGSSIVWGPQGGPLFWSTDLGATWKQASGGPVPREASEVFVPVADRVNARVFTALDGRTWEVYQSADGGGTWAAVGTVHPTPSGSFPMQSVPGFEGHLWLPAGERGLLRSTDGGRSWDDVSLVSTCEQVGFGAPPPGKSYPAAFIYGEVMGAWGLYRSDDQGESWTRINDDGHSLGWIVGLTGDPVIFGRVYVATNGRGLVYGEP